MEDAVEYALLVVNDDVTPEGACGAVGFCPDTDGSASSFDASAELSSTLAVATRTRMDLPSLESDTDTSAADCLKCKFGVEALHEAVTSNDTVAALLLKADDACEKYATAFDLASTCEAAVATYAPTIVEKATAFLADAEKVCAQIGMCPPPDGADDKSKKENARLATARFSFARGSVLKKMAVLDAVRGGVVA
mmetsp:Transcript_11464/g.48062  ORF Transcript_11464/g.48062 Transcript_11464/m.48062 type:complete len:194 (+) Transcript_11464:75-656(+)